VSSPRARPGHDAPATGHQARVRDARHTAATLLLAQGVDHWVLMEILGRSQISMTSRYAHVLPQVMTDAAERIDGRCGARHEPNCNPPSR
jgi:site-specific recombinase XerD